VVSSDFVQAMDGIVSQELARHEQSLRQKLDEQQKELQKQLDATKNHRSKPPAAAGGGAQGTAPPADSG
jgi:hypothetical protein